MFEPVFVRLALIASIATGVSLGVMGVYLVVRARRVPWSGCRQRRDAGSGARSGRRLGAGVHVTRRGRRSCRCVRKNQRHQVACRRSR